MTLKNGEDVVVLDTLRLTRERISKAAAELEEELRAAVREARRAGATWQEVGDAMQMSKQAAWEKFRNAGDMDIEQIERPVAPSRERRRMVRDYTDEDNVVVRIVGRQVRR